MTDDDNDDDDGDGDDDDDNIKMMATMVGNLGD